MRQITILAIGKMKDKALESLQQEYCKRLQAFCEVRILEVKDEANEHTDRPGEAGHAKDLEAGRALEKIRPGDFVILLDLHGLGPGQALLQRADVRWKLSDLTFTHLMTRVLLLEQIYRGFMIRAGRSYHK